MKIIKPLNYKYLRKSLNPKDLDFATTDDLSVEIDFLGHERALEAINLGIGIKSQGYNYYVMGPPGIGKRSLIRTILRNYAQTKPSPDDWCYIHNFKSPEKPLAVKLPPGDGMKLKMDMDEFIEDAKASILTVYESNEYRIGMQEINDHFVEERDKRNKEVHKNKTYKITCLYKQKHEDEKKLLSRLVGTLIKPFIEKLLEKYSEYPKIVSYLKAVEIDILQHIHDLVRRDENSQVLMVDRENDIIVRYQVNLFVNNSNRKGLPVIIEENPTYTNLISQVENKMLNGTLITDFTLLRSGSLHRANSGFLILEARKITKEKFAWDSLKNALYTGKIAIESIEHMNGSAKSVAIKPKSIPLKIKIVLVGDRNYYYKLSRIDPDFNELFKVAVDFDDYIDRNKKNINAYARFIATLIKKRNLRPFDRTAVAAVIDYSTRLADDTKKLSNHTSRIDEVIRESNYWAKEMRMKIVGAAAVRQAIASQIYRMDRSRELYYEDIQRDFVLINTKSFAVGEINCLSVVKVGNYAYGHPTRVTVKVRLGKGEVIDIQRDIKLAGSIHSKSTLTIANYLAGVYARDEVFSLTASISFEQIYGMIDGDSASVAELCAFISALTDIPLNQALAVTGSINQNGEVQSVGGINEKIEGFFDICNKAGLDGNQGVIIPAVNIQNLMLREDIVAAARANKFKIYPIKKVDEAIALLTGLNPGIRNKKGEYPQDSVNAKIEMRLKEYAEKRTSAKQKKMSEKC